MIGVWIIFALTWSCGWVLMWQDFMRSDRIFENGIRYMWLITIGLVLGTAILLGVCV